LGPWVLRRESAQGRDYEDRVTFLGAQPSNLRIAGIALLLFSGVLLGVGIHHLIATGTCSSTGYSANYGPVPTCPSGTGWWFAFVFGGVIGGLIGALMASSLGLVFAGIFGAIGFGALSILLDSHVQSGEKVFSAVFGGCFALVGAAAGAGVIASAIGSLRTPARKSTPARAPTVTSAFGPPQAASAFGTDSEPADPIRSAYAASRDAAPSVPGPSPLSLAPGLRAARQSAAGDTVEELAKLADLHHKGALTDEEFADAKAKLLGRM
jgi:predicted lipid-binding transport protein (Tim44 family)